MPEIKYPSGHNNGMQATLSYQTVKDIAARKPPFHIQPMKNIFAALRRLAPAAVMALSLAACHTTSHLTYMENLGDSRQGTLSRADYKVTIQPEDELQIIVTSAIPAATSEYNLPNSNASFSTGTGSILTDSQQQSYFVDRDGNIAFPKLGTIHVAGLTTAGLRDKLLRQIGKHVKDPNVRVLITNFHVNVMGEVRNPHRIHVASERFSIFDALAAAGDMTEYGRRDNVTVIREEADSARYVRLDLRDPAITASPYYYLRQNDVVIVEPNDIRQANSRYNQNNAFKLSVISTIVGAVSVIASLVIALAVH